MSSSNNNNNGNDRAAEAGARDNHGDDSRGRNGGGGGGGTAPDFKGPNGITDSSNMNSNSNQQYQQQQRNGTNQQEYRNPGNGVSGGAEGKSHHNRYQDDNHDNNHHPRQYEDQYHNSNNRYDRHHNDVKPPINDSRHGNGHVNYHRGVDNHDDYDPDYVPLEEAIRPGHQNNGKHIRFDRKEPAGPHHQQEVLVREGQYPPLVPGIILPPDADMAVLLEDGVPIPPEALLIAKGCPDHGKHWMPGGAGPESEAPKSLDHFKRGYEERAATRDKEFYARKLKMAQQGKSEFQNYSLRERSMVVEGMDALALIERLEKNHHYQSYVFQILDQSRKDFPEAFESGKAATALISGCSRRRNTRLSHQIWAWLKEQSRRGKLQLNTYHYNSMIAVAATDRKVKDALTLMEEMDREAIEKNEVTYSSAITACEKSGDWRTGVNLLDNMEKEGLQRTPIAYNAAISACEKGMVPQKACEVFNRMKREGIKPSVVSYSALISAAEKGSQWKLALEILEDMKRESFRGNVIAYSAAISALAKGQQWEKALELFRELQSYGKQPSIVTYNATMTALEKGLQWERALDLFDEMKDRNLPITVVSYGSAISACDKGLQYRQCLEFLDEMTEMGIAKNVIIFGAAMSCMEKCCRADIGFQLMERMKLEGITPNVHIYNSAISACARSNLWEKGYALFQEMDQVCVKRDVVTYNAVLDAVASQIQLGRMLFEEGVKKGFYARVSRLAKHWFELDLHFMSLGGGEIALGWWFEECLVPFMVNTDKLKDVKSISIVTGYGKTRTRGRRMGDDGMRKRCKAMLRFMNIREHDQPNLGRIHIDMEAFIAEVKKNDGKIKFDLNSYIAWREKETTVNVVPDVPQKVRARYKPEVAGSGQPPFIRIETESTSPEYRRANQKDEVALAQAPIAAALDNLKDAPVPEVKEESDLTIADDKGRSDGYEIRNSCRTDRENRRPSYEGRDGGRRGGEHRSPGPPDRRSEVKREDQSHYGGRRGGSDYDRSYPSENRGPPGGGGGDPNRGRSPKNIGHYGPGGRSGDRPSSSYREGGPPRDDRSNRGSYRHSREDHYGPSNNGGGSNHYGPSGRSSGPRESSQDNYHRGSGGGQSMGDDRDRHQGRSNSIPQYEASGGLDDRFKQPQQVKTAVKDERYQAGSDFNHTNDHYGRDGGANTNGKGNNPPEVRVKADPDRDNGENEQGAAGNDYADRKRGYSNFQGQQSSRGYNLEPDRQKRRHS